MTYVSRMCNDLFSGGLDKNAVVFQRETEQVKFSTTSKIIHMDNFLFPSLLMLCE